MTEPTRTSRGKAGKQEEDQEADGHRLEDTMKTDKEKYRSEESFDVLISSPDTAVG